MPKRAILLLFALIFGASAAPTPQGQRPDLAERGQCRTMLDQSLSMSGFYQGGRETIGGLVDILARECDEVFLVGTGVMAARGPRLSEERPAAPFGNDTRLGEALRDWLNASNRNRMVLITDNVADSGGGGATNPEQQGFYDLLKAKDSNLTHLSMLILRLPFQGLVYRLGPGKPNTYGGDRALTIYVLERNGPRGRDNDAFLERVERLVREQGFRRYAGTGAPAERDYAIARLSPFLPGIETGEAGMTIAAADGGRHVAITPEGAIEVRRGASDRDTLFTIGKVQVSTGPDWDFGNAPFSARLEFPADPTHGGAIRGTCAVNPPRTQPGLNRSLTLALECTIPPVWRQLTAEQRKKLALEGKTWRPGELVLAIETRNTDLTLSGPLQKYFGMPPGIEQQADGLASTRPEVQERVYKLPELLANIIPPEDRTVVVKRFPLRVHQAHSAFDLILSWLSSGLLPLLALAVLAALFWWLARPVTYDAQGVAEPQRFRLGLGGSKILIGRDGSRISLMSLGLALVADIGTRKRLLWRSGGKIRGKTGETVATVTQAGTTRRTGDARGAARAPRQRSGR